MNETRVVRLAGVALGGSRHVCVFYSDEEEARRVVETLVLEGFERGDRVLVMGPDERCRPMLARLGQRGIDVPEREGTGQLRIEDWSLNGLASGRFDLDAMVQRVRRLVAEGRALGFPCSRLVADMEWAVKAHPETKDLVEFEAKLDQALAGVTDRLLCLYDTRRFCGRAVIDVLRMHATTVVGGVLQENPFYVPPEVFLRELGSRTR